VSHFQLSRFIVARLTLNFLDAFSGLSPGILSPYFVGRLTMHSLDICRQVLSNTSNGSDISCISSISSEEQF